MFLSKEEQNAYIKENYQEITDSRIDELHWDIPCSVCGVTRGFFVTKQAQTYDNTRYSGPTFLHPQTITFHCPVCQLFKLWIVYEVSELEPKSDGSGNNEWVRHFYKVTSLPGEGLEEIDQLPEDPASLRIAYRQAIRAMDANAHMAAAAMFRRALQVITRDILGATPSTLANELKFLKGKQHNGATLSETFETNSFIVKETGNQGAHPDEDPDLLDFTQEDAEALQEIFMELVSDLFIVPEAKRRAKQEFMQRRKITPRK